jgi:glycosyltransferase involved in cell wall biosynthesis
VINRIMERQPFDLVYVNGPRLLIAAAFASRGNAATIFHAHSLLGKGYAAKLARWSIDRTNAMVLACSNFVAAPLKHAAEIVPNGIADLRRREFYTPADWRVGIIGRISPEKGQAEFVQAAALLAPKFPTMRFVICGAPLFGDKAYADRVTESARGLPVEFLGWQSDVAAVLSQIDLLAVPSKDEGMGRVIIEAFSAEVPVVAFPEGGIPEVITDGATGFLTRESTAQALADRIAEIVQSPDVKTVVNNARAAWEQNYTIAAFQETIRNLIGAAVTRERASQRPYR